MRRFAAWLSASDPRTEIPPHGLLPHRYRRRPPYIYSDQEVARIVRQAARLPSPLGLRAHTYATIFGLLAATGLRLGEALTLDRDDVDLCAGVLAIRRTKFGKSRFVPIHDSTRGALRRYARRRDLLLPRPTSPAFLLSERGTRVTQCSARYNFAVVSRAVGLRAPTLEVAMATDRVSTTCDTDSPRGPSSAGTVTDATWSERLPKLSTYLGHVHVADTYWYIEAVPELLRLATERAIRPREEAP